MVSNASGLLQGRASARSPPTGTYPFADVEACFAFANCFCALQNGVVSEQGEVCLARIGSKSLPGLMLQGACQVAAEPGAPGLWPLVLMHLVLFATTRAPRLDRISRRMQRSGLGALLKSGLQLIWYHPQAASVEAVTAHGAAAAAASAFATGTVLQFVVCVADNSQETGRLQSRAAFDASSELLIRCAERLTEPAASLLSPLPLPQRLLLPQASHLQV